MLRFYYKGFGVIFFEKSLFLNSILLGITHPLYVENEKTNAFLYCKIKKSNIEKKWIVWGKNVLTLEKQKEHFFSYKDISMVVLAVGCRANH